MTTRIRRLGSVILIGLILPLAVAGTYRARGPEQPNAGSDQRITSTVEETAAGELLLVERIRIAAPLEKVWNAYTTSKGYRAWAAISLKHQRLAAQPYSHRSDSGTASAST